MESIIKEISKVRESLKKGPADTLLMQKPFAEGMYIFSMFIIDYYSRVRSKLNIDYDSFIIIQTVVAQKLYQLKKSKKSSSYEELEKLWENMVTKHDSVVEFVSETNFNKSKPASKLSISSICLVTGLPKETVRRKVNELAKRNLLKTSQRDGVLLGSMYKKIFQSFVPQTTLEVSRLLKSWEKIGILKSLLSFKA